MYCVVPTIRSMRAKFFFGLLLLLSVYIFLFYLMVQMWLERKFLPMSMSPVVLPHVVVHIDLKGAPPKLEYLESLLPMLKEHGVTDLLMEYEDMFPYEGMLKNISSRNCYGSDELRKFLHLAAKANLQIIPLIQTFGHMEHVLKLQEFMHLREKPAFPDSICPSKNESRELIKNMLQQVINFHNFIAPLQYVHIGCDEVYHINACQQCSDRQIKERYLYAEHLTLLGEYIQEISPQTSVLIWDDILRTITPPEWGNISLAKNMQPVYWEYKKQPKLSHVSLLQYHKTFGRIWIASAFKGADGREETLPDLRSRYHNHFNLLKMMRDYRFGGERDTYNFEGIILTGWSRYSHFAAPCELLPPAIPSLLLNLLLIRKFKTGGAFFQINNEADSFRQYLVEDLSLSLNCHDRRGLRIGHFKNCDFDGKYLYETFQQYEVLKRSIMDLLSGPLFSTDYYASKRFLDPNVVKENIYYGDFAMTELLNIRSQMSYFMQQYYENDVIGEYVSSKTISYKKKLRSLLKKLKSYTHMRVWDRSPFNSTF